MGMNDQSANWRAAITSAYRLRRMQELMSQ